MIYFMINQCKYYFLICLGKLRNKKIKNFIIIFRNYEGCLVKRDIDIVDGKQVINKQMKIIYIIKCVCVWFNLIYK